MIGSLTPSLVSSLVRSLPSGGGAAIPLDILSEDVALIINHREYRNAIQTVERSGTKYQVCAWWTVVGYLSIAVREVGGDWTTYLYNGTGGLPSIVVSQLTNDHRVVSVGVDLDGIIHFAYDHHNTALKYRVSDEAIEDFDGAVSAAQSFLGTNETSVSYVQFFNDATGNLYTTYRSGGSGLGEQYFYSYDESTGWAAATGTGTNGLLLDDVAGAIDYSSYVFTPWFDSSDVCHWGWYWRKTTDGATNTRVSYVAWDGTNWTQADGTSQTVPITRSNCDIADDVAEGSGLAGSGSIAADDNGYPHLVYFRNDEDDYSQIFHTWFNGNAWQPPRAVTNQTTNTSAGDPPDANAGTPNIVIDESNGNAWILFNRFGKSGLWAAASQNYFQWSEYRISTAESGLWAVDFEPYKWKNDGELLFPLVETTTPTRLNLITHTPTMPTIAAPTYDDDALTFFNNRETADSATLPLAFKFAVNDFVLYCKDEDNWDKIGAAGIIERAATLAGAIVPLIGGPVTNNGFVGADYDSADGLTGSNASNKQLVLDYDNTDDGQNDNHNVVYIRSLGTATNRTLLNAGGTGTGANHFVATFSNIFFRNRSTTAFERSGDYTTGFIGTSRSDSAEFVSRIGGVNETHTNTSETTAAGNIYLYGRNDQSLSHRYDGEIGFYSVGAALDLAVYQNRVDRLMAALLAI